MKKLVSPDRAIALSAAIAVIAVIAAVAAVSAIPVIAAVGAAAAAAGAVPTHSTGAQRAVPVLAPERLRDLLPSSLGALERGDISAERVTALGVPISQAEAQYRDASGHYITLRIEDMGGASGIKSLLPWTSAPKPKQSSSSGDEKTYRSRGRIVHQKWDSPAGPNTIGYGEYAVVVGRRYLVEASGKVAGIDALKRSVRSVDMRKLESLAKGGAQRN